MTTEELIAAPIEAEIASALAYLRAGREEYGSYPGDITVVHNEEHLKIAALIERLAADRLASLTSPFGNPFIVGHPGGAYTREVKDRRHAYLLFKSIAPDNERLVAEARAKLAGKNLACWCPRDDPYEDCCHAAVLLELANPPQGDSS